MSTIPLPMLTPGRSAKVCSINGSCCICRRLSDMGLGNNAEVEVLEGGGGSLIVKVNGSRYALGRGMANKIMVRADV